MKKTMQNEKKEDTKRNHFFVSIKGHYLSKQGLDKLLEKYIDDITLKKTKVKYLQDGVSDVFLYGRLLKSGDHIMYALREEDKYVYKATQKICEEIVLVTTPKRNFEFLSRLVEFVPEVSISYSRLSSMEHFLESLGFNNSDFGFDGPVYNGFIRKYDK